MHLNTGLQIPPLRLAVTAGPFFHLEKTICDGRLDDLEESQLICGEDAVSRR